MKQFLKLTVLILITTLSACHKNSDKPSTPPPSGKTVQATISTTLSGIDSFSNYATAFNTITLTDADVSQGITVFAPVNQAFTTATTSIGNMPGRQVITTGDPASRPVITGFTLPDTSDPKDYIVKGIITSSALTNGATFTALSGYPLTVTAVNGNLYLNGVLISGTNISSGANYLLYSISGLLKTSKILKITGLSDSTTFPGWLLTINGQNFDTAVANNIVKINGAQALVHTATANQLVVTVPPNATSGKVTVATRGTTLESKQSVRIMQAVVGTIPASVQANVSGIQGITLDANDNLYFTNDNYNGLQDVNVVKMDKAGNSVFYTPWFPNPNGDGTSIPVVSSSSLWAIAVDNQNNVYYQNTAVGTAPGQYTGIFKFNTGNSFYGEWWAGNNGDITSGPYTGNKNAVPVRALALKFDAKGNLIVGDQAGIRKIAPNGQVSFVAAPNNFLAADPTVTKSPSPYGLDIDAAGNIFVSDGSQGNNRIWKISTNGTITSIAGNNNAIAKDGIGADAQFGDPFGLVLDQRGNIYVCDNDYTNQNFLIRMINPQGVVTTIAGRNNPNGASTDGIGTNAIFNGVNSIAVDSKGVLYVGPDEGGIRTITIQ
ncbi:MAG TPA: IPT/TIG domain-containing protein [Puia sp.]|nr:IPT/TIG domain-containing protein [Puia sp.]